MLGLKLLTFFTQDQFVKEIHLLAASHMVTFTVISIWWYGSVLPPPALPGIHGKFGQGGLPGLSLPFHGLA